MEPLTDEELRVLGCLIEKEATVPDLYPLTRNALRQACNQSSSRDPVVAYDDLTVQRALDSLKARGLARFVHPAAGERATKFRHVAGDAIGLERDELALVAVLVLRGAQTAGELRTRTERQHAFESTEEVESALARLRGRDEPLVIELPRQAGQHHARWMHLLGGPVDVDALEARLADAPVARSRGGTDRILELEAELAALAARVARLEASVGLGDEPGGGDGPDDDEVEGPPDYS